MAVYLTPGQYEYAPGIILRKPNFPPHVVDLIQELPMEEGDVCVATYPKAGTTWMEQILSLIYLDGDVQTASQKNLSERVLFMDLQFAPHVPPEVEKLVKMPHPWLTKTHLPAQVYEKQLEAKKGKFIIVMRNPKDNLVSYYHFYRANCMLGNYSGTFHEFFETFKEKKMLNGDWLDYNLSWWKYKDNPNVLILMFEDMKADSKAAIKRIAEFCGKNFSDDIIDKIVEASSFKKMKDDSKVNQTSLPKFVYNHEISPFMRKGVVGDWVSYFSEEENKYVDEHYMKVAAEHGLHFQDK